MAFALLYVCTIIVPLASVKTSSTRTFSEHTPFIINKNISPMALDLMAFALLYCCTIFVEPVIVITLSGWLSCAGWPWYMTHAQRTGLGCHDDHSQQKDCN